MWTKYTKSVRALSLIMIGSFCMSHIATPALAMEVPENTVQSTDDLLIDAAAVEAAVFSVTVPTSLPAQVDGRGVITTANNALIINNSDSAVQIVNMTVQQTGDYKIVGYDENFADKKIDSKQMALSVYGFKTQHDGTLSFDNTIAPAIGSGQSYNVNYSLKATMSSEAIDSMHAANVYITIDWANPVKLNYDANGGVFTNGTNINTIQYTDTGHWIGGFEEIPTRANCFFEGWYTDAALTQKYNPSVPTTDTTVYAKWLATYTVEYAWQRLDHSYLYEVHESETFIAPLGTVVWPEVRTYDQYKTPAQQSLTVDDSGNCVLTYKYDRTTYWLDVNYIVNGVFTGGPGDGDSWPSGLYYNFMAVYLNGYLASHGRDYCVTQPFGTYYEIKLNLGEEFYYVGTYNEGADTWDNGTTLYRKPDSGTMTENVGIRLVINSATDDLPRYYITFDANGGEGYTEPMTMIFGNGGQEIDWLNWCNYTREGYTFGGWMTTPDGDTAEYQNEQKVSGLSNTNGETITLYALWIPNNPFAIEDEEEASEGEEIDEEMSEEDEEIDEEESDDEESPGEEETPSEEETPGEEETEQPEEGVDGEPPVDPEPPLDTEPTQPGEDSTDQEEPPDDSDTTPDSPPDTPTTEPGDETTPDVDDETTTPDVDDENESDDTPQETPADTPEDDNLTDEDVENPDDESNISPPSPDSDETPVIPDESTLPDEGNSENPDEPSDDIPDDETDGQVPDDSDSEDAGAKNEDDIIDDPENSDETESEETESEEEESEESEESEEDSEQEDPVVEPTYYCGFDKHVHGEDCPGATCDTIEHEHDASCLIPAPPVENVDPEPEIPEEGTQDSEETQEPLKETPDDESSNQEAVEEPPSPPVEETLPPKEEVIETKPAVDSETEEPPAENDETATPVEEEITEEPTAE